MVSRTQSVSSVQFYNTSSAHCAELCTRRQVFFHQQASDTVTLSLHSHCSQHEGSLLLYPRQQRGSGRACDSQGPEARLSKKNKGFHSPVWTGGGERGNASAGWGTQHATHGFSSDNFLTMSLSGLRALRRNIPCSHKITDLIILYCDCTVFLFSGV